MKIIIAILLLTFTSLAFSQSVAMIDSGVNINKINQRKLINAGYHVCKNYNDDKLFCDLEYKDEDSHGTDVFNVLEKGLPNKSIIVYSNSFKDIIRPLSLLTYPKSLKEVYDKKKILLNQSDYLSLVIEKAINNRAIVINMSLGSKAFNSKRLKEVIVNNPEVIFVFAAGNDGKDLDPFYNKFYPCSFKLPNTLCVGALKNGQIADYSNHGRDVDLYVKPKGQEGTSFSAPIIANKAFLLRKTLTVSQTIAKLKEIYKLKGNKI